MRGLPLPSSLLFRIFLLPSTHALWPTGDAFPGFLWPAAGFLPGFQPLMSPWAVQLSNWS